MNLVTRLSQTGKVETLPELIEGRYRHACGSFITDEGDYVRFILNINKQWTFHKKKKNFVFGENIFRYVISVLIIEHLIVSKRYIYRRNT